MSRIFDPELESHEMHDEYEREDEFEGEGELEFEDEGEFEGEFEDEYEYEDESEDEAEAFFGGLFNLVRKGLASPTLRKLGMSAAKSALGALTGGGDGEAEWEDEGLLSPIRRIYPDALMEHLGHAASEAESEDEVSAAVSPLVSLAASKIMPAAEYMAAKHGSPKAAKAAPHIAHAVMKVSPHMTKAVKQIARTLHRSGSAKPLIRTIPHIVRKATAQLAKHAAHGHPITSKTAVRALARQAAHVLGNPKASVHAYRHSKKLDHRYHGPWYRLKGRPVGGHRHHGHHPAHGHRHGHRHPGYGHPRWRWGYGGYGWPTGYRGPSGTGAPSWGGAAATVACPTCGHAHSAGAGHGPVKRRRWVCSQCRAVY